jgi:hypothetical protein
MGKHNLKWLLVTKKDVRVTLKWILLKQVVKIISE